MAKSDSPLAAAAAAYEAEFATYQRLADLFVKTPLNTIKHLDRANESLAELAECEQRLQQNLHNILSVLTETRKVQEGLAGQVVAHAPKFKERKDMLAALTQRVADIAKDASQLNAHAVGKNGDTQTDAAKPDLGEVSAKVMELADRANELHTSCRDADFDELAEQAHTVHQKLKSLATKLSKAGGN